MIVRRRNPLSILGLVASDASYYLEGTRKRGDPLKSLPDSDPGEEYGFPQALWGSIPKLGDPFTNNTVVVDALTPKGGTTTTIEFPAWRVVDFVEGTPLGFGATIFRLGDRGEYLVAMRGTDGADPKDWVQDLGLSVSSWLKYRDELMDKLFIPLPDGAIPATGIVHFAGQSLGGGLAQYAAYEFVLRAKAAEAGANEPDSPMPGFKYRADRVTLTTFNAFAGGAGLFEIYAKADGTSDFDPNLLKGVQTAHYVVSNDLVHRLGAKMEGYNVEVDGVLQPRMRLMPGYGHLNGAGNTFLLDFRRPGKSDDDPQSYLGIVGAHRIESGFYQGFDVFKGDFESSARLRSHSIDYLDLGNSQWVASRFSQAFMEQNPKLTNYSAGARLVLGLASSVAFGNPGQMANLIGAGIDALYRAGQIGFAGRLALGAFNLAILFGSLFVPALSIGRLVFTALDALRGLTPEDKRQATELLNKTFVPANALPTDPGAAPSRTDEELAVRYRQAARVLAANRRLTNEERERYILDPRDRRTVIALEPLRVDPDAFMTALDGPNGLYESMAYLQGRAREAGLSARQIAELDVQLVAAMAEDLRVFGATDAVLAATIQAAKDDFVRYQMGEAIANANRDLTAKYASAGNAFGTDTLDFRDYQPIHDALAGAMDDPAYAAVRADIAEALRIADSGAQKIVIRDGASASPFAPPAAGLDADAVDASATTEARGREYTIFLPYAAGPGGQRIALRVEGADADKFTVFSANGTQPVTGGRFSLVVPEGTRQIAFTLWNDEDVDASQTLTLHAALAGATGVPTHKERPEATIALAAVDEPPFTPPAAVVTDLEPASPEVYGTDADEQILGKVTTDVIYPLLGADVVLADAGDDRVLVYWSAENDSAGDRIDLGGGNDFAVRWAGEDTLIGGSGADVMLAGADADELYAESEIVLADAIALGESQSAGGAADLLDGWAGNDTAVGWGGADGLLGGDGEDVLVGMGGDDNVFGDLQFSQYTTASADWRVERETTWLNPDRRRVAARLVSVLVTQKDVPGGADTIFGGAGADWLFGQAGDDFIDGGRDDDVIFGHEGADALFGRDGADILSGDDLDDGTPEGLAGALHGADSLDGGAGDDELAGNGGDDQLYGGDGDDSLGGDDPVTPGAFHGKDYLDGGAGRDKLWGEGSDDWLTGGDGDDHLEGDYTDLEGRFHGADHLDGGAGDDELIGQGGADELHGGEGNDTIAGDDADGETLAAEHHGDDFLDGGAGNDALKGGGGEDRLFGGDGQDSLLGDGGSVEGDDALHGGAGGDTLQGNGGKDLLYGDAGEDFLDGGAGDDLLHGGVDRDRLEGGAGDDVYVLQAGDSPSGGALESIADRAGSDTLRLSGAGVRAVRRNGDTPDLVVSFGASDEVLIEGGFAGAIERFDLGGGVVLSWQQLLGRFLDEAQDETSAGAAVLLAGGAADDTLTATGGGAVLAGGRGDDVLTGAGGGNTYLYHLGDGTDRIDDTGGAATAPNRVVFGPGITPDDVRLATGSLRIQVGGDRADALVFPNFDPDDVLARRAVDLFEFADGTTLSYEQLIARGFDVDGTGAAETLTGTNVVDRVYGADGDDTLSTGAGDDVLDGGAGNDTLTGGAGDDVYRFGYGDGQDTLADGAAGDSDALALFAGAGPGDVELERLANDLVVKLRDALDQVTVRDQFAGDGIDRIDFADGSFWDRIEIGARIPNRLTEGPDTFNGSAYADTIYGRGGDDRLYGQTGDDLVDGGDGADQLYGGDGDDRLLGQAGADWLAAGAGADTLEGGADADSLYGEDGADTLSGGAGDDALRGGAGSDRYRFAPGDGRDTIDDYDASANRVDVLAFWASDSSSVALRREWSLYDSNDDLYFDLLDAAGQPTGEGVKLWRPFFTDDAYRMVDRVAFADAAVWTAADIRGRLTAATGGDDRFRGFGGADALDGGAGDDYVAGGEGNDVILGGDGADSLWGENGDDVLEGGAGDDALSGDFTYPSTWLYQGRDVLRGGAGADSLDGGGGADVLEGGPGADRLLGGEHDDVYLYARGDGADEIEDRPFYSNGTGGSDTLRFAAGITPAEVERYRTRNGSLFAPGDDLTLVIDGSSDQVRIASYFAATREIETIEFADGTRWTRADVEARLLTGAENTLTGTTADDTFAVDNDRDVVVEPAGGGTDTIESIVSYALPANVEHLTLTGSLNASATGNDLDNVLRGNANGNRLVGGRGADTLIGGRGDDVYLDEDPYIDGMLVPYTPDTIVEAAGEGDDTVEAKAYDYALPDHVERLVLLLTPTYSFYDGALRRHVPSARDAIGNALDNVLDASRVMPGAPVVLDGGGGADAYIGHEGPDTYRIADAGDVILATGDATPQDAVESAFDFDLAGFGLTLTLIGDAPVAGRGNDAANTLDGSRNAAANVLAGGRGDDRYVLGAGDRVVERPGEGRDTVQIAGGPIGEYRLDDYANAEALELGEPLGVSSLVGGAGDDTLTGNRFANRLDGGPGSDVLAGGDGGDTYVAGGLLGRRRDVARIAEDRITDDDTQYVYGWTADTVVLGGLQDDLQAPVRIGNDLVLEQVRRDASDPADDLLFESVRMANYFAGARYQVERVRFADGAELDLARLVAAGVRVPGADAPAGVLTGSVGPDALHATDAASTLQGGFGDDLLRGGAAGDVLAGEGGNDRLLGGAGDDRYAFASGFGRDYVEDAGGDDVLEFAGVTSGSVVVHASGDRLELAFASGDAVVVHQDLANGVGVERAYFAGDGVWLDAAALAARAAGPVGNLAPFVHAPPRDRAALEDQPFALALRTDAFVDLDAGDTLAWSLAGAYGASLPTWLAFDAPTRTLSGTPGNGDVGATALELVATDPSGARATWTMNLVVSNVNDAPVATPPAAQTAFAGQTYVLALLPEVFSDPDAGDYLWVDATLANGDPLPGWLWLDDGALWGDPTASDLGRYAIALVATDSAGATATAAFTLDVLRENHAPALAAAIPNQTANEDASWSYVVPAASFTDADADDVLAYSATLASGGALPSWLAFDPVTRRFSGLPGNEHVGTVSIEVTATDTAGATASDAFDLTVSDVNDAPQLLRAFDAASVEEGQALAYFAHAAFADVDAGDALSYSATLANGAALPSWLTLGATTGKLTGTPAIGAIGTLELRVTARDGAGATATLPLAVTVTAAPPQHLVGTSSKNTLTGKSGDDRLDGGAGADTMRGGLGHDTYVVDNGGDSVQENASAGSDLVESSVGYSVSSRPHVEHVVLTGTAAINATGNGANNMLRGNAANNTLTGGGGVDVLQGLGGNDTLRDSGGNGLAHGGDGADTMSGNAARQLFIGGAGNDTASPGAGADLFAFNAGDGQDSVNASSGADNAVSLGGGIAYDALFLSRSGNHLVLETGPDDRITFKDWYASAAHRSVATLQVIAEAMAGYDPNSSDPLRNRKVARFDFAALVQAFDAARAADANITRWRVMDALLDAHLAASDAEALGGDLAYRYGLTGSLAGVGFDAAAAVLGAAQFATAPQPLQPAASLQQGTHRLA